MTAATTTSTPTAAARLPEPIVQFIRSSSTREHSESYLIAVLQMIQKHFGYLPKDCLNEVSELMQIPSAQVTGVATFYHFFTLKPKGKHSCVVCMGTACYVKGAAQVLAAIEKAAAIRAGETTPDEELSLVTARCIGTCGIAPAVVYDGKVTARQTPETALEHVKGWIRHVAE